MPNCHNPPVLRVLLILSITFLLPLVADAKRGAEVRRHGDMTAEELRRERVTVAIDVPYAGTGNPQHRLDIYLPKKRAQAKLPAIVFFFGGGWEGGDKSDGAWWLMPYVRTGNYAGVSAGYRQSGEAVWPAQLHDGKAVIRWVRANAEKYGLDPDRIAVMGRSAGGHLALSVALSSDMPGLEGNVGPHTRVTSRSPPS